MVLVLSQIACGEASARTEFGTEGRKLYVDTGCSACHGGKGEGGVGPPLANVLDTFATCEEQVEWVKLGSAGWESENGPTYGSGKPVKGGMPGFGPALTEDEIKTIVVYERTELGGGTEDAIRADCDI